MRALLSARARRAPTSAVLPDGARVGVRHIRPDDVDRLARLHGRCSPETLYRRFLTPVPDPIPSWLERLTSVDGHEQAALVAQLGDEIVGVARYHRAGHPRTAEVSILVEDAFQRRGLATLLLSALLDHADREGIDVFTAETLADNQPVRGLLAHFGFELRSTTDGIAGFERPPSRQLMGIRSARARAGAGRGPRGRDRARTRARP